MSVNRRGCTIIKKHPGHQTQVFFSPSILQGHHLRCTTRIIQSGGGSERPLPALGIMIGGRMKEPGSGKMLNKRIRIGVPHFPHRETACSPNHEGRRTLTTAQSGTAVESFLASLSPSSPR